ncbi:Polynucleotide 5'-hydroxyl-kinase grc3 [Ceratobasidium sp. 395]|nr:Polynucleotide 5'-hydroxyl-kinase grc3 [Ceratobasidium sp. 395]
MASNQTLSAVARRKAALLRTSTNLDGLIQQPIETDGLTTTSVGTTSAVPLKRKTSAATLKETVILGKSPKADKQSRKKSKAERTAQNLEGDQQVSTDPAPRAYSPSQPVVDSSDEDQPLGDSIPVNFGACPDEDGLVPQSSIQKIPEKVFDPVDGQNSFSLSIEEAFPITGQSSAARLLVIQPGNSLIFTGTMGLLVLQGSVRLMGTLLLPSRIPHRVFAPHYFPVPSISVPLASDTTLVDNRAPTPSLSQQLPKHIRSLINPDHSAILIFELFSGVEGLGKVMYEFGSLFEPDARGTESSYNITKELCLLRSEPQGSPLFYLPQDWETAMNDIAYNASESSASHGHHAPVILVKGAKNSGKSTFSRTLANNLTKTYRRVAFIECDLGQSPAFTHLGIPRRAHFIGGTSPKSSPSHYLAALTDLSQHYQSEFKFSAAFDDATNDFGDSKFFTTVPLIINTQGWVKGMGADLLRSIEDIFEPSHIVDFQAPVTYLNPSTSSFAERTIGNPMKSASTTNSINQISVVAIPPSVYPPRFSAADLRSLSLVSYFYGCFSPRKSLDYSDTFIEYWDTSLPLKAITPLTVNPGLALESIVIAAPGGSDVTPSELSKALVCGVVGLVAPESPTARVDVLYTQGTLPPSPQVSRCVGLGFVRGVSDTKIQLLTPIPIRELGACRSFVLGEIRMPAWAFVDLEQDSHGENELPYLQWGRSLAESAGGGRRRIRRNVMRRSQA